MQSRPSHVKELVRNPKPAYQGLVDTAGWGVGLAYQGLVDAAGWGVGGVWFSGFKLIPQIVWFFKWSEHRQNKFCNGKDPDGPIIISDLEQLGIFMH